MIVVALALGLNTVDSPWARATALLLGPAAALFLAHACVRYYLRAFLLRHAFAVDAGYYDAVGPALFTAIVAVALFTNIAIALAAPSGAPLLRGGARRAGV